MRGAMAVVDEVLSPPADAKVARRPRVWIRVVMGFVVGVILAIGVGAAALYAWDAGYEGRILPGVHVGSTDLSGLDRDQAATALATALAGYADGRLVIHTVAGDVSVPYSRFSRRPDVSAMVDEAMTTGRTGTTLERALLEPRLALEGETLQPRLTLDESALALAVDAAVAGFEVTPIEAGISTGPRGIITTAARTGRTFDAAATTSAALVAVRSVDAPPEVVVQARAVWTSPALTDADVAIARMAAKRMTGDVVVTFGGKKWTIKASTVGRWIGFEVAADGSVQPVVDRTQIPAALGKVAKAVKKDPVSAKYLKSSRGRIVGVAPSSDGRRLDTEATTTAIADALAARGRGAAAAPVGAVTAAVTPKLTTEEAVKKAPLMKRLGSWKTWFPISERNYFGANIWLPAKFIDGTVLEPGQTFEWWRAVGPVTAARGFGLGGFIAGDHTEPTGAIGGGMCSSSTTLFNAALRAGLRMGARSNHRYYINRYPLGLDATVSGGLGRGQTMTFTNDMANPIVIRSFRYTSKGLGWVRYEIWGIPDGRTVSLTKPAVSNLQKATTYKVYVTTLPHGVRKQTEYPANGMDVSVTRTVRDSHGRIIHRETYRSHYTLWNGRIEIGL